MIGKLSNNENLSFDELKKNVIDKFGEVEIFLYGSKVRGEGAKHSDIDILVLLKEKTSNSTEEEIFHIGFEIEMKYGVIFGIIVYSRDFWDSLGRKMPLFRSIEKEGILIP